MLPRTTTAPNFRPADADDLRKIEVWLREERAATGEGFYCNWNIITGALKTGELFVVDVGGEPVAFLANEGTHHNIAEVRPDLRGQGYGKVIADAMIAQSEALGLSVIEIACAPEESASFWAKKGFTPVPSRQGYGGGIYAYREIPRPQKLSRGRRVPFAVRFFEERVRFSGGEPFRVYEGEGEKMRSGRVRLPERAVCYDPKLEHLLDCYAEIEVEGVRLFFDKTKRDAAREFGIQFDKARIPYIEAIRLPD